MTILIRFALCLLAVMALCAQTVLVVTVTVPDVTGTSATVQVFPAGSGPARTYTIIADSGNSNPVRCGGATTSATAGLKMAAGGTFTGMALALDPRQSSGVESAKLFYDLTTVYCYIVTGDKVSLAYSK